MRGMLRSLHISHFAIIDELQVDFAPGLNVITGETGAGKSILIEAVNLLLGGRASADLIRTGEDEARVEALFHLGTKRTRDDLLGMGFDVGDDLVVQRVVSRSGRNKVLVNGSPATVSMLSRIAPQLIDISGQHEHHSLLDPEHHRELVDAQGQLSDVVDSMRAAWSAYAEARSAAEALAAKEASRLAREDYLRFQLQELEGAAPEPGEYEEMMRERAVLGAAGDLSEAAQTGYDSLYGDDGSVTDTLGKVVERLRSAAEVDSSLQPLVDTLAGARIDVEETARSLSAYVGQTESNPARLEEIESRLALLQRLAKKHTVEPDALASLADELASELEELSSFEQALAAKRKAASELLAKAGEVAKKLTRARKRAGKKLSDSVREHLGELGMPQVEFEVRVSPIDLGPDGADAVEFRLSSNPGEELRPLAKIASGGELSRITLALKCALVDEHPVSTYVFDEVDAGIGGGVAEVVGRKIAAVAGEHQVMCITHLPQIAVFGESHYRVSKLVEGGRTHTQVEPLSRKKQREDEIARMLGGVEISAQTRAHAREMLRKAS